eukprot:GHVR01094369.1.p1 GENE.GHVR01094369.1~~GHVR01094369.1.p1  ORF type:complete len:118 (-),score=7.84 GHVR01094369.1:1514-1867(-)
MAQRSLEEKVEILIPLPPRKNSNLKELNLLYMLGTFRLVGTKKTSGNSFKSMGLSLMSNLSEKSLVYWFCLVKFSSLSDAEDAIEKLKGMTIHKQTCEYKVAGYRITEIEPWTKRGS